MRCTIFMIAVLFASVASAVDVSSCQNLSAPNTAYLLINNLSSSGTCLNITADNVTLDCAGNTITFAQSAYGDGIDVNANSATIENCTITNNGTNFGQFGVRLSSSSGSVLRNNSISISGNEPGYSWVLGISLTSSSSNTITNNTIFTAGINGGAGWNGGFYLEGSSNNTIANNTITSPSNPTGGCWGININPGFNSTVANNTITVPQCYSGQTWGIAFWATSNYSRFYGNSINSTLDIYFYANGSGNIFLHNNLTGAQWVSDYYCANSYNDSTSGNIYYLANGTEAWEVFNITDTGTPGDGWADEGSDLPFMSSTVGAYWEGSGQDWHPRTLNTAPSVALNSPPNGALLNQSQITLNWTPYNFISNPVCNATRNGTILFSGACTNGTPCTSSNTTADGTYYWNVTCYSGSENAASETGNFTVDTNAPAISINSPTSNSVLNSTTIGINITVNEPNLNYTNISIIDAGGIAVNSTTSGANGNYAIQLGVPSDGVYNITSAAYDLAGNGNSTTNPNVTVDTGAPVVAVQSPANATYNASSVRLNFTAGGTGPEISACWYSLDGGNNTTLINCANRTVTPAGDGPHTITVYANDSAGNTGSAGVSFTFNSLKTNIQLAIRNQDLRPSYLTGISLDGDYVSFNPPFYFPGGIRQIISFGLTNSLCNYTDQLIYFKMVTIYYTQSGISGLAQSGSVPLVTKCS